MKYNPEGHDVHVMAKKLLVQLENKWDKEAAAIIKKFSGASTPASGGFSFFFTTSALPSSSSRAIACVGVPSNPEPKTLKPKP
jgi:hypothetical protein